MLSSPARLADARVSETSEGLIWQLSFATADKKMDSREVRKEEDYVVISSTTSTSLHAVVVPLPSQGHITPALQLAKELVRLGFRITFVNTIHNHERMVKSRLKDVEPEKGIEFVAVSDGLPEDHPRLKLWSEFLTAILAMGPTFEELFATLLRKSPITCVIRDMRFASVHESATKLAIPVVGFGTPSAISLQCAFKVPAFLSMGILPLPPPPADSAPSVHPISMTMGLPRSEREAARRQTPLRDLLPGASPTMRVGDMPTHLLTHDVERSWERHPLLPNCECLLLNTFHALEGEILDAMARDWESNVFAVGPLVLNRKREHGVQEAAIAGAGGSLREEDPVALSWLDGREPNSTLFVSFGSEATVSVEQMQEFAHGLEMSGRAFLWVIRSDTVESTVCEAAVKREFETVFSEFVKRTRDRALLTPWAPQAAVLSHRSVAAFLTHCGWNSTIESIVCGVPILGWPRYADQTTNCHYISQVWKVGIALQSRLGSAEDGRMIVAKEEVDQKVRKIMASEEDTEQDVGEIRRNSGRFKVAARTAVAIGGSSHTAMAKFMALVESWRIKEHHPNN